MQTSSKRYRRTSQFLRRHQDKFVCLILFSFSMMMFMRGSGGGDDYSSVLARNRVLETEAARWSNIVTDMSRKLETLEKTMLISGKKERAGGAVKIFVYDLPTAYNEDILNAHPSCGPDAEITWETKYATEVYIHQRLLKSRYRTKNPEEADLFYVPVYHACYLHARATKFTKAYQLIRLVHRHVQQKFPYWNRTMGRDHVWTFAHDMGGCVAPYQELRHSIWITTTGEMLNRKKAFEKYTKMYDPTFPYVRDLSKPCFSSWKDVVMPPYLRDSSVMDKSKRMLKLDRTGTLASFRGTVIGSKTYSRGIRQLWAEMFKDDSEVKIHVVNPDHETEPNYKWAYYNDMSTSQFCLAPPGWASWTPRVFEALALSCIPVIVTDGNRLPFESRTKYQDIALFVAEKKANKIKTILKSVSKQKINIMQTRIRQVSDRFLYTGHEGDAFDYLMMELKDRADFLLHY